MTPPSLTDLPDSAHLAWWLTAWLLGATSPDALVEAVRRDDAAHDVTGLPGTDGPLSLVLALGRIRALGATSAGLALPAEGDPVGLGGPATFNADALTAGEAVVLEGAGRGLVPFRAGRGVVWTCRPANRRQLPDIGEADRGLRAAMAVAAQALADLDVARWRPEVADELMDLRRSARLAVPPGVPARCVDLAARGARALAIVDLALADDGGAVSATEAGRRRAALVPLAAAARRAVVAACSPEAWPPGGVTGVRR